MGFKEPHLRLAFYCIRETGFSSTLPSLRNCAYDLSRWANVMVLPLRFSKTLGTRYDEIGASSLPFLSPSFRDLNRIMKLLSTEHTSE